MLRELVGLLFIQSVLSSINGPALVQLTQPVDHAEGPTWDNRTGLLYFVDIHSGKLLSYDTVTDELNSITLNGDLAVAVPSESNPNLIIVGLNRSVVVVEWDGKNSLQGKRTLTTVAADKPTSRFNDGKADQEGRLWFGTMGYEDTNGNLNFDHGSLFLITRENLENPEPVISPVNISNGLAWNRANDKFFYIDTPSNQVMEYDYDNHSGSISNPRVVFDVTKHSCITGHPDGMTIDEDDNLWIALYNGGAVIKVNPRESQLLQVIAIPAQYTTSVTWGGPNLDVLFVTTSRYMLSEEERRRQPAAGSVFAVLNLGTKGLAAFMADVVDHVNY